MPTLIEAIDADIRTAGVTLNGHAAPLTSHISSPGVVREWCDRIDGLLLARHLISAGGLPTGTLGELLVIHRIVDAARLAATCSSSGLARGIEMALSTIGRHIDAATPTSVR